MDGATLGVDNPRLRHWKVGRNVPVHENEDQLPYIVMIVRVWQAEEMMLPEKSRWITSAVVAAV